MDEANDHIGAAVAVGIPWETTETGLVQWKLVDWTVEDDNGVSLPVLDDSSGDDPIAWGGDYAIEDLRTGGWTFPDGETCDDAGLADAFVRRGAPMPRPNRQQRRAAKAIRDQLLKKEVKEAIEGLEAEGKLGSVIGEDGKKRYYHKPSKPGTH